MHHRKDRIEDVSDISTVGRSSGNKNSENTPAPVAFIIECLNKQAGGE